VLILSLWTVPALSADPSDDGAEWRMPARDYASTRFSPLDEITPLNARELRLAFSSSTGVEKGHEAAPIVVGDTMYVVTPYPNYVFAFDLTNPGANVKWKSMVARSTATRLPCPSRTARKELSPNNGAGNVAPRSFLRGTFYRHANLVDRHVVITFDFRDQLRK
jgi:hypothetical protein